MKQFTRCTNCRQWYRHSATSTVEIVQGDVLRRLTVWCRQCMQDAENRSQAVEETARVPDSPPLAAHEMESDMPHADFRQLVHEHFSLMEQALHADEDLLVPRIDAFIQRCHSYQQRLTEPALVQRLAAHVQYWHAFLQALQRSP